MDLRLSRVVTAKTVFFVSLFCVLVPLSVGASETQKRLRSTVDDSETFVLRGNTRPALLVGAAKDMGAVPASQAMPRMSLNFALTAAQRVDLAQLLSAQQNRRSPQYRKFLTPEEYADRFGLNRADIARVTAWLENNGFSNIAPVRSRMSVAFSGTAGQAQAAFHTSIHAYSINGESHFANASDPLLPKALEGVVESVGGLHNFLAKPSMLHEALQPHYTSSSGANYLVPDDWETIYDVKPLYSAGLDGSPINGQTYSLVVVGQSDVQMSDLTAFRAAAGLSVKAPVVEVVPGDADPGLQSASGDQGESDLDLEWAGAIAKNANILFLIGSNPGGGVQDAIAYAIDNNVAPILSTSYGQCEQDLASGEFATFNALFAEAAIQGMTIVAPSGDAGAAACDTGTVATQGLAVRFPASSQYVTGIGGTKFNPGNGSYFGSTNNANGGSAVSYIPEIAWNDGNQAASGGGVSTLVTKPSWQTGTGVPNDGQRDVPDLAFTASLTQDGLLFCNNGSCTNGFLNASATPAITGGTSAGPPTFAGVLALLVQKTGARVGFLNQNLYSLAAISGNAFHDITAGNNDVVCQGGSTGCPTSVTTATGEIGYSAGVGYDPVTGWGSIDSYNFVEQWSGDIQLTASPATIAVQPGGSQTATITVTPINNFSGPVTFSCSVSSSLVNITCSVPSTTVNISGSTAGSTTVTITAAANPASGFLPRRLLPQQFPKAPLPSPAWLLVALALSVATYPLRKRRFAERRSVYKWTAAGFAILTLGAVSCGSGSSSGTLSLSCNLPEAFVAEPYIGGSCVGSGGNPPYTYSILTGTSSTGVLPAGLSLNASSGVLSGTPTVAGLNPFTVTVTDKSSNTFNLAENLTVAAAPALNGLVTVTATSGSIVNTTSILVSTSL